VSASLDMVTDCDVLAIVMGTMESGHLSPLGLALYHRMYGFLSRPLCLKLGLYCRPAVPSMTLLVVYIPVAIRLIPLCQLLGWIRIIGR
jgi:hypothetical protein